MNHRTSFRLSKHSPPRARCCAAKDKCSREVALRGGWGQQKTVSRKKLQLHMSAVIYVRRFLCIQFHFSKKTSSIAFHQTHYLYKAVHIQLCFFNKVWFNADCWCHLSGWWQQKIRVNFIIFLLSLLCLQRQDNSSILIELKLLSWSVCWLMLCFSHLFCASPFLLSLCRTCLFQKYSINTYFLYLKACIAPASSFLKASHRDLHSWSCTFLLAPKLFSPSHTLTFTSP